MQYPIKDDYRPLPPLPEYSSTTTLPFLQPSSVLSHQTFFPSSSSSAQVVTYDGRNDWDNAVDDGQQQQQHQHQHRHHRPSPSTSVDHSDQTSLVALRKSFLLFTKILFTYINNDPLLLEQCKLIVMKGTHQLRTANTALAWPQRRTEAEERSRRWISSIIKQLKETVGQTTWDQVKVYYKLYRYGRVNKYKRITNNQKPSSVQSASTSATATNTASAAAAIPMEDTSTADSRTGTLFHQKHSSSQERNNITTNGKGEQQHKMQDLTVSAGTAVSGHLKSENNVLDDDDVEGSAVIEV